MVQYPQPHAYRMMHCCLSRISLHQPLFTWPTSEHANICPTISFDLWQLGHHLSTVFSHFACRWLVPTISQTCLHAHIWNMGGTLCSPSDTASHEILICQCLPCHTYVCPELDVAWCVCCQSNGFKEESLMASPAICCSLHQALLGTRVHL